MQFTLILLVFAVIFASELPDKSMIATLVLGTRYRALYVWIGAAAAFLTHVIIAVVAGQALNLLPHRVVEFVVAALFLAGALLLLFGKHGLEEDPAPDAIKDGHSFWKVAGTTYGVVFLGEWGDITQIMTANYVAHYHAPLSVGLGAVLGLWAATTIAVVAGSKVLTRVPGKLLQRVVAAVLLLFAGLSLYSAIR
ncbi:MAG TPA: TMEM165/GDT1 family protein [Candidatus Saccharimonadales bacterium]|nr:TMEM165/GDT1 family protein [Candidatus Saccharimonadales bacterium]